MTTTVYLVIVSSLLACNPMDTTTSESTATEAEAAPVVKKEEGKTVAAVSAESSKPQKLEANESSDLGQSNAVFRPGAIAAQSEVTIEQGVDIVDPKAQEELGLQENYVPQSKPVNISSTEAIDGSVPLTISLELSEDLSLSAGFGGIYVAFYVLETEDGPKLGIVPTSEISLSGSIASFDFTTEGDYTGASFQLAAFVFSGASNKEVESKRQIVAKSQSDEEEPNIQDEDEISDNILDESTACPDAIDPEKIDSSLEVCGVKGSLDLSNLKPEHILSGQSIAGVSGTLINLSYNDCSSDGQKDCIATQTFPAGDTTGLAAKVIAGNAAAGIMGTANEETRPNCTSDGESNCIASSTYPAASTTALAAKVLTGNTVAGVSGSATAQKTNCSSDGATDCATTASYAAALTTGLAAKVISGNTVAGIAGTVTPETNPNCSSGNQTSCVATSTYKTMDLTNKDAGGALDITNANFETRVKSASTFEYWDQSGIRHTNTGDADITAANIDKGITIFGTTGTAVAPDCSAIGVGGTWILVPGDPDYGTNDFCVMKYEAKCSLADGSTCTASASSESPTATAANTPWVSIDQQDAKTECASLGKGYHLITNDEWMTIATNVAAQGANWDRGTVGTNEISRGHSDNNPTNICAADADDNNAYVEGSCSGSSSGTFNQRRTHTLSSGEVIWDLAGNVNELTSFFNDMDKPDAGTIWIEYSALNGSTSMPSTDLVPNNALKSFWNDSWNSSQSIGHYYPGNNSSGGGALIRGGRWYDTTDSGVFTASLGIAPTYESVGIGFRCAVSVP